MRPRTFALAWVLVPALLVSCAGTPTAPTAEFLASVSQRTSDRTGVPDDAQARLRLRLRDQGPVIVGDLDLERATRLALAHNPALAASAETLALAQAELAQAGLFDNPTLGQNSGFLFPVRPRAGRGSWDLNVAQNINTFLTRGPRVAAAEAQKQQTGIDHATAAVALASSVRAKYAELLHLTRQRGVSERIAATYHRAAEAAEARSKVGLVPKPEVNRARLAEADAQRQVRRLESQWRKSARELHALMGGTGEPAWTLPGEAPGPAAELASLPPDADLETMALAHRLDLERAEFDTQLADAQLRLARTGLFPTLNTGIDVSTDGSGNRSIGPFFSLTLPIFNTGRVAVTLAEDQYRLADKSYVALRTQVRADVRSAAAMVRIAQDDVAFAVEQMLPQQEQNVKLALEAFQLGAADLDSYLNTLRDYSAALQAAEDARDGLNSAVLGLEQALGVAASRVTAEGLARAAQVAREAEERTTPPADSPAWTSSIEPQVSPNEEAR